MLQSSQYDSHSFLNTDYICCWSLRVLGMTLVHAENTKIILSGVPSESGGHIAHLFSLASVPF